MIRSLKAAATTKIDNYDTASIAKGNNYLLLLR